jgi:hypothetical protein
MEGEETMSRYLGRLAAIVALMVLLSPAAANADRGPSTPEERTKAVDLAKSLESDPLGSEAPAARKWLTQWLIAVPDISVNWCTDLMGPILKTKKNHAEELSIQPLFSAALFVIQTPEKSNDQLAVNVAAVEGTLRAYEVILRAEPTSHLSYMDDLLAKRDKGTLVDHVREVQQKCK